MYITIGLEFSLNHQFETLKRILFITTEDLIQQFVIPNQRSGEYADLPFKLKNKPQLTGIIVLSVGVALLTFTFINAYLFLQTPLSIIASENLAEVFGLALAPLIQACIHLMYLGIMGWIGSLLTMRGIPLVTHKYIPVFTAKRISQQKTLQKPTKQEKQKSKPKQITTETKTQLTSEPKLEQPEAILIPPQNQGEE
jgi:hypothetical protein